MKRNGYVPIVSMCAVLVCSSAVFPVEIGTAFTYQGNLQNPPGSPVTDTCDFHFSLWDDDNNPNPGTQKGPTLTFTGAGAISVVDGLFSVPLDFGAGMIDGTGRWLQIDVVCLSDPGFPIIVPLSPRVELTPAPHALALPGLYTQENATSPNLIGGYSENVVATNVVGATIGGGGFASNPNQVTDNYGTVSGGYNNTAASSAAAVGGGHDNVAIGGAATIGGGQRNTARATATVGGGSDNTADGGISTIGGGSTNIASADRSTVGGGIGNTAGGISATVSGGDGNTASGLYASVPGGENNTADGNYGFAAGRRAKANHDGTFVWGDSADADCVSATTDEFRICAAGGVEIEGDLHASGAITSGSSITIDGTNDTITATSGTISFDDENLVTTGKVGIGTSPQWPLHATINTTSGDRVVARFENLADPQHAFNSSSINVVAGDSSGGFAAYGPSYSAIPGYAGYTAIITGFTGVQLVANSPGGVVRFITGSSTGERMRITSNGNVGIGTTAPGNPLEMASGAHVTAGGVWTDASSREKKENFVPANLHTILEDVISLPIAAWNYKNEDDSIRHVGPVAEDFHALFGFGADDKHLAALDTSGVALAAIQGLHEIVQENDCELTELRDQKNDLKRRNSELEARLATLERIVSDLAVAQNGGAR